MGIHGQEAKNQGQELEQLSGTDAILSSLSQQFLSPLLTSAPLLSHLCTSPFPLLT